MYPLEASLPMYWKNIESSVTSSNIWVVCGSLKPAELETILDSCPLVTLALGLKVPFG